MPFSMFFTVRLGKKFSFCLTLRYQLRKVAKTWLTWWWHCFGNETRNKPPEIKRLHKHFHVFESNLNPIVPLEHCWIWQRGVSRHSVLFLNHRTTGLAGWIQWCKQDCHTERRQPDQLVKLPMNQARWRSTHLWSGKKFLIQYIVGIEVLLLFRPTEKQPLWSYDTCRK